jgi:hypothetical protein
MSVSQGIMGADRELSLVLDSMLEIEHEKSLNSLLDKSFFGSASPGSGMVGTRITQTSITRERLPLGSNLLQKVMQEIRHRLQDLTKER